MKAVISTRVVTYVCGVPGAAGIGYAEGSCGGTAKFKTPGSLAYSKVNNKLYVVDVRCLERVCVYELTTFRHDYLCFYGGSFFCARRQYGNVRIRSIALDTWTTSLIAGTGGNGAWNSNGAGAGASFGNLASLTIDDAGKFLFVVRCECTTHVAFNTHNSTHSHVSPQQYDALSSSLFYIHFSLPSFLLSVCLNDSTIHVLLAAQADYSNSAIRSIDLSTNTVATLAGTGTSGAVDGNLTTGTMWQPQAVRVISGGKDAQGNAIRTSVYFSDASNYLLRRVNLGTVGGVLNTATLWGQVKATGSVDGVGTNAKIVRARI